MPSIYYCRFLGDGWSEWKGGHRLPELPENFDKEVCTVAFASRDGEDWCYVYDPHEEELVWSSWDGQRWSGWEDSAHLPPPPNWRVQKEDAFFSVSSHDSGDWAVSYNPADGTVYWSPWTGRGYASWEGPIEVDDPPNLSDVAAIFSAGDGEQEWLISIDMEDWSTYYATWEGDEYSDWMRVTDLPVPDEWLEFGVTLDGDGRSGHFWVFAIVYDDRLYGT